MPKPVSSIAGADTFAVNARNEVCLIMRSDNGLWALPGGAQDLNETPEQRAKRKFREETDFEVGIIDLLGVFNSMHYQFRTYPYKDKEVCHLLFRGEIIGGNEATSEEALEIGWFAESALPEISDGHITRISFGFDSLRNTHLKPHFE